MGPSHPTIPLSASRIPPMPGGGVVLPGAPSAAPPPPPFAPPPPSASMIPIAPPPLPASALAPQANSGAATSAKTLTIRYQGRPHDVKKDRFIIGRGKTSSDLTIRDPNVSRQHALVEFSGGNFYMVDMGSTNGIEFSGQRVQRKAIQNGDVFRICDHELFCTMN